MGETLNEGLGWGCCLLVLLIRPMSISWIYNQRDGEH